MQIAMNHWRSKIFILLLNFLLGLSAIPVVLAEDWIYTVVKGDNLWNITEDYLIDVTFVDKVRRLNNIADPWHILPGTKITIPGEWIRQYPAISRVINIRGNATIQEAGLDEAKPLATGAMVMLGDIVATGPESTLVLAFMDGSKILLQENSRLKINRLLSLEYTGMSDVRLELKSGRIETLVEPSKGTARRFQINTPVTVTSVRGTDYRISAEEVVKESRAEVVTGKVKVTGANQSRLLTTGFGTVTVAGKPPKPPVKLLPPPDITQLPDVFLSIPLQMLLPVQASEQSYRVQIAASEKFVDVLFDKIFPSNLIRGPELEDGLYFMRVRAIDSQRLEGLNSQRRIVVNAKPEPPFLVLPKPGEGILIEDQVAFNWSQREEVKHYHFQIAADESFSQVLIDIPAVEGTEVTVNEKQAVGKYFWRVAAIDEEGDGPFSDGQLIRRILPGPDLEQPEISENTLVIRSRKGLPGQHYQFQMSEYEDFQELMVDQQAAEPSFEIALPDAGEYYVRVRTIDPDGFVGPFGAVQTIDIPYDNLYLLLLLLPLFALFAL